MPTPYIGQPVIGDPPPNPPPPPPPTSYPPAIVNGPALPDAAKGAAYSQPISVINGTTPYSFAIVGGALPAGLALGAVTGLVTGTPSVTGAFSFIVNVTDAASLTATATFTIAIPTSPSIVNQSLPAGFVGTQYAVALSGQGGAQPYGYRVLSGNLPAGLILATTGGITGTPTTAGTYTFVVQIYDSNAPQGLASSTFTVTIAAANLANVITTMDNVVLIAKEDGGLYAIIPGQSYDTDYNGAQRGFLQRWAGVPGPAGKLALMQLGGGSISAKGSGALNVVAIDDARKTTHLSSKARPMLLSAKETKRDFMAKGVGKSERFGIALDNGSVIGAWFEVHTAILWLRQFFTGRKG